MPRTLAPFLAAASVAFAALLPAVARAIEEPDFQVTQVFEDFELRLYPPFLVAETVVPGPADEAGNQAFPILAGYIFGKNKGEKKLEMTAPVSQEPVKLEMTAPVTQAATAGGFRVQFVMPKGYTLATLPEPLDPRVTLREMPARRLAVLRYSGGWSQSAYETQLGRLKAGLAKHGIAWRGEPVFSRYNGPFSLWFMRRNEIWLELAAS